MVKNFKNRNNFFCFATLFTISAIAIAGAVIASPSSYQINGECTVCDGNHYNKVEQTETTIGCKEFWRCCTCHNIYTSTSDIPEYESSHWHDNGTYTELTDADSKDVRFIRRTPANGENHQVSKIRTGYTHSLYRSAESYNESYANYNTALYDFYKDSESQEISYGDGYKMTIKTLWENQSVFVNVTDTSGKEVTITNEYNSDVVKFTTTPSTNGVFEIKVGKDLALNDVAYFNFTVDGVTRTAKLNLKANPKETSSPQRKLFNAVKTTKTDLDCATNGYNTSYKIDINNTCQGTETGVWGNAYMAWNETTGYFYVLFEVADENVDTTSSAENFENDCVEFWINTCRSLPFQDNEWGTTGGNRVIGNYNGEGGFKFRPGQTNITGGAQWMYDDKGYSGTYMKTSYGYNVEMKIPFKSFFDDKHKAGSVLDVSFLVVNGTNNTCTRKAGSNSDSNIAWSFPAHMDHIVLVTE